jgi:septal ring factor EnvC (AmiA/AmiB activator)
MSDDLDDRIANLREQRQLEGAGQTKKAADLAQAIDDLQKLVRETAFKAATAQAKVAYVEDEMDKLESRVRRTRRLLVRGIAASSLLGALILLAALWSSSSLKTAARVEADTLRIFYADQIDAARQEGNAEMAAIQAEISARRADIERQIIEVRAELSEIADERDSIRTALEELVDLRDRVGLELVEYRGRVIFVVPDGSELLAWRAPGLSEMASFNGRMYQLDQ